MTGKMKLLIGLLVLGVVVVGIGVWLKLDNAPAKYSLPVANPIIYEKLAYVLGTGEANYLYIYDDGSVVYIEERGLRFPSPERPATRIWKAGSLTSEEFDNLIQYLGETTFEKMQDSYFFPGKPAEGGGSFDLGDMQFTVTVVSDNLTKSVYASGYLTPDQGETYPDMPAPLNEIYVKLRAIAQATKEVARENISQ